MSVIYRPSLDLECNKRGFFTVWRCVFVFAFFYLELLYSLFLPLFFKGEREGFDNFIFFLRLVWWHREKNRFRREVSIHSLRAKSTALLNRNVNENKSRRSAQDHYFLSYLFLGGSTRTPVIEWQEPFVASSFKITNNVWWAASSQHKSGKSPRSLTHIQGWHI